MLYLFSIAPAAAQGGSTSSRWLRGLGIEESLAVESTLEEVLEIAGFRNLPFQLFVFLHVPRDLVEPTPRSYELEALDERLETLHRLGAQIVLSLDGVPPTVEETESWRLLLLEIVRLARGRAAAYLLQPQPGGNVVTDPEVDAYVRRLSAVQIRSAAPEALIVEGLSGANAVATIQFFYESAGAPYADAVAVSRTGWPDVASFEDALSEVAAIVSREDPTASLIATGMLLPPDLPEAASRLVRSTGRHLILGAGLTAYRGGLDALGTAVAAAARMPELLANQLIPLDVERARLTFEPDGDPGVLIDSGLLYDANSGSTYLVFGKHPASRGTASRVAITLTVPSAQPPVLKDPVFGEERRAVSFDREDSTRTTRVTVPLMEQPLLLEFRSLTATASVSARSDPDVGQIIAQHQQAEAVQDNMLHNYIATATMEVHFQLGTGVADSFDVVTENRFYFQDGLAEWEELSFSLNGTAWGADRPPFPLLQPAKVLTLPLILQLNDEYRYRLEGRETIGGNGCYVVAFEPIDEGMSLYRGRVWIDEHSFIKRKLQVVQTELSSPVASNEETQVFSHAGDMDGVPFFPLSSVQNQFVFLVAGRNVLVEKRISFTGFELNRPDFSERRAAAHASDRIMLRETDDGLRYLVKRGGERVVSDELTRTATAVAMGVAIDPALDQPLPIFGINHLDFNFLDRDLQLALLFGGVLALGNIQKTEFLGSPFDVSFDFFAIGVRGNDRLFIDNAEIPEARLRTLPGAIGLNLGWQFSDFQNVTGSYHLSYDHYWPAEETAEDFQVPSNTFTNTVSLVYEYRRNGYSVAVNGSYSKRVSWEPWGLAFRPGTQSYSKYGLSFSKSFYLSPLQKLQVGTSYFDGQDLDRFTMYQTGLFSSTQIHGVPAGAVRFDKLAIIQATYAFNMFDLIGFDIYVDQVFGRDPINGPTIEPITGVGIGLDVRGPWRTLLTAKVATSVLPESYRGAGSFTADILFLKPF